MARQVLARSPAIFLWQDLTGAFGARRGTRSAADGPARLGSTIEVQFSTTLYSALRAPGTPQAGGLA